MGLGSSTPSAPSASPSPPRRNRTPSPPRELTSEPWRNTKGWDRSVRDELKQNVASMAPDKSIARKVPFFNILLTGQIGAGKSSFYNSISNLFCGRIVGGRADTGESGKSLTKEYRVYEIRPGPNSSPLAWRICDTMGLESGTTEVVIRNLLSAVDGHVPDKYTFIPGREFTKDSPGYISKARLAQKAHCIAVVIDASNAKLMNKDVWDKLRSMREGLISRNIPTYIILSHIDKACDEVSRDVTNVFHSVQVCDIVSYVSRQLMGLPENQIFPVKNYSSEVELEDNMDILLLYAMRQMLYSCQGHIENQADKLSTHCCPFCICTS